MAGLTESGVKVATGFMDSLKEQPLSLALVVMNFALIGYVYYESSQFNNSRTTSVKLLLEQQARVTEVLSKCVVPNDRRSDAGDIPLPRERPSEFGPPHITEKESSL